MLPFCLFPPFSFTRNPEPSRKVRECLGPRVRMLVGAWWRRTEKLQVSLTCHARRIASARARASDTLNPQAKILNPKP